MSPPHAARRCLAVLLPLVALGCGDPIGGREGGAPGVARQALNTWTPTGGSHAAGAGVSAGPGGNNVYSRAAATNQVMISSKYFPGGGWSQPYGATFTGSPAVASTIDVSGCEALFVRRDDGQLGWVMETSNYPYSGCQTWAAAFPAVPGAILDSSPAVTSWGTANPSFQRFDVFARDAANHLLWNTALGSSPFPIAVTWQGWQTDTSISLYPGTEPAAVSRAPGTIDLFVLGMDARVAWRQYANAAWGGWVVLDGLSSSSPAVTNVGSSMALVTRGLVDLDYRVRTYSSRYGWSPWVGLGGAFLGKPATHRVSLSDNSVRIYGRGLDGQLWAGDAQVVDFPWWWRLDASP